MALVFTDDQLKTISQQVLQAPVLLATLNDQKAKAVVEKAAQQTKDNGNDSFFTFFRTTINEYHNELKNKNGAARAAYTFAMLDDAAAQRAGNFHYPTSPPWTQMKPKLIPENNGNPTTAHTPYELDQLPKLTSAINLLKTGFTDGATDDTLTTAYVSGQDVEVDTGPFTAGQRVVIDDANVSLLAIIVAVKPPSTTGFKDLELNVLTNPAVVLGLGARIRNFHAGFSNTEREHTVIPYAPEVRDYWETLVDPEVTTWETTLTSQLTALNAMDPGGAENTQRDSEKTKVNAAKSAIDTWQAAPGTGAGVGRYGDTVLNPLQAKVADRTSEVPTRVTEITTALGSVTQNPDGTFAGAGHYLSLFKWVDIRASKAGGSLFAFYGFDLIFKFLDQKILTATNQKAEYDAKILVKKLTEDADGTPFVKLTDVTGLAISDSVKVLDDTATPILSTTIVGFGGNTVQLAANATGFLVDKLARLVKEL